MHFRSSVAAATGAALLSFAAAAPPVCKVVTVVEPGQPTWVPNKSPNVYPTSNKPIKGSYDPYTTEKGHDGAYPTTSTGYDSYETTTTTASVYPTVSHGYSGWGNWNTSTTLSTATYSNTVSASSTGEYYTTSTSGSGEYYTTSASGSGGYPTSAYPTATGSATTSGATTTTGVTTTSAATSSDATTTTATESTTGSITTTTSDATSTTTTTTTTSDATSTTTTTTTTTPATTTTPPSRNCPDPTATFVVQATQAASDIDGKYAVTVDVDADRRLEFSAASADTATFFSFTTDCQVVTAAGQAFVVTDDTAGEFADPHYQSVLVPGDETPNAFSINTCSTTDIGNNKLQLSCTVSDGGAVQNTFSTDEGFLLISTPANTFETLNVVLEEVVVAGPPRRRRS